MQSSSVDLQKYDVKSDVWSFGLVCFEMCTERPWPMFDHDDRNLIVQLKPPVRADFQPWMRGVYQECLCVRELVS